MNLSRISRLLELLRLLQAGRGQNANGLAQACRVSRRTIFRDLETLRAAGVPLEFDPEFEQYHVPSAYLLPPTHLSAEEALAMIALCHEMGGSGRLPFFEAARSAAMKLESSLPARMRETMRSMIKAIRIKPSEVNLLSGLKSTYEELVDAITARRPVRIGYHSFSEQQKINTKLSPYQLLFSRHSWYVIGRSSLHRQTRTFNLARINKLEPLEDSFKIPRGFSVERYLRNAWHLIPEPGGDREVTVRFQPLVARNIAEVAWHRTQRVTWNGDGTLDFHVTVTGLNEISWWILGYGDQAEVLEPADLREIIGRRAASMAATYNGRLPRRSADESSG